jgi:hypothetical protein
MLTEPLRRVVQLAASLGFGSRNAVSNINVAAILFIFNFGRFLGNTVQTRPTN